jgi:hypothetical protein
MTEVKSNKQINGTFGTIWVNNEKWADVDSFEAKITIGYEDVNMAGSLATYKKMNGWEGKGSITVKKVYSRGSTLLANQIKNGIVSDITIVGKLADPDAFGAERISFSDVTFDEFMLMQFEQKKLGTEELPFAFADFDPIDLIKA